MTIPACLFMQPVTVSCCLLLSPGHGSSACLFMQSLTVSSWRLLSVLAMTIPFYLFVQPITVTTCLLSVTQCPCPPPCLLRSACTCLRLQDVDLLEAEAKLSTGDQLLPVKEKYPKVQLGIGYTFLISNCSVCSF